MTGRRGGFGLVVAVLGLLLLEVFIAGALLLGSEEVVTARADTDAFRLRLGAEGAVRAAVAAWDPGNRTAVPVAGTPVPAGTGTLAGDIDYTVTLERPRRSLFLVRAVARRGPAIAHAAAFVRMAATDSLWLAFGSPLIAGSGATLLPGASVDGRAAAQPPPVAPACPPAAALDAARVLGAPDRPGITVPPGAVVRIDPAAVAAGAPPVLPTPAGTDSASFAALGAWTLSRVATLADRTESGAVRLAPTAIGAACDTIAAGNWGALNAGHPCAAYVPLIVTAGDLTIATGTGQGLLVVNGDLDMAPGTAFAGAVLVRGNASLDRARIDGALRVAGMATLDSATVRFDPCALWRAFTFSGPMRRPHNTSGRWWLPGF